MGQVRLFPNRLRLDVAGCRDLSFLGRRHLPGSRRAPAAFSLHHGNVRREVNLHGVARSIAIALAHGLAISADGALHFRKAWQPVVSDQIIGNPFTLQFSQRHDRAQRLQQSDKEEITELRMKHPAEER
jgi:hypothetical protein